MYVYIYAYICIWKSLCSSSADWESRMVSEYMFNRPTGLINAGWVFYRFKTFLVMIWSVLGATSFYQLEILLLTYYIYIHIYILNIYIHVYIYLQKKWVSWNHILLLNYIWINWLGQKDEIGQTTGVICVSIGNTYIKNQILKLSVKL
jgi:hypothetical protein